MKVQLSSLSHYSWTTNQSEVATRLHSNVVNVTANQRQHVRTAQPIRGRDEALP